MRLHAKDQAEPLPGQAPQALIGGQSPEGELLGSWLATRWQYINRARPGQSVDVVCDLGGSVTLSLSAATWVLTWMVVGEGSGSVGGSLAVHGDHMALLLEGATRSDSVLYRLSAATLSLSSDDSSWDFNGQGEEPAEFVAVLVRL